MTGRFSDRFSKAMRTGRSALKNAARQIRARAGSLLRILKSSRAASGTALAKLAAKTGKAAGSLRRILKSSSAASGTALTKLAAKTGKTAGSLRHILKSSGAASGTALTKLTAKTGKAAGSLLRILGSSATVSGRALAKLAVLAGKAALWLLQTAAELLGRAIDALPKLLTLALATVRALFHFSVYVWQTLVALWAFLYPYLRRIFRIVRGHMLASAVTATGLVAIVLLIDIRNPEPVDEREIPVKLRPKVIVAALLSLTGKNSDYGIEMLRGYRIAADAINEDGITVDGRLSSLELLVYDDESDPDRAGELAEHIAKEHEDVRALLAPYSSLVARPAAIAAARNQIPVLAPAASAAGFGFAPPEGVMLLQTPPAAHLLPALGLLLARAKERKIDPKRLAIALAWLPDPHSAAVAAGVSEALARLGAAPPRLIDLAAAAEQFEQQAAAAAAVDALFVAGYGAGAARIMQQLRSTGRRPPIVALTHCALGRIGSIAPRMASGALCMRHWQPEARHPGSRPLAGRAFASGYQLQHGRQPTHHAAAAAAAILVIAEALRQVEDEAAADIKQALAATDLATFYGPVKFGPRGSNSRKPMLMAQLQFGKYVPIWPTAAATGEFDSGGRRLATRK